MSVAMIGPKFYAWDRNGKPLAFGKLYTYQARTNNPKDTYQSEDQITANSNPVILNGEGYANVYLSGSYKMVLKDDDENEIWTSDPVSSAEPSEWVLCLTATYSSPTTLKVNGNFTEQYGKGRRVRINNNVSEYSYSTILSSSFALNETTIKVLDPVVTTGVIEVCASIITPNSQQDISDFIKVLSSSDAASAKDAELGEYIRLSDRGYCLAQYQSGLTPNGLNLIAADAVGLDLGLIPENGVYTAANLGVVFDYDSGAETGTDNATVFAGIESLGFNIIWDKGTCFSSVGITIPQNTTYYGYGEATKIYFGGTAKFVMSVKSELRTLALRGNSTHTESALDVGDAVSLSGGRAVIEKISIEESGGDAIRVIDGNLGTIRDVWLVNNAGSAVVFTNDTPDNNGWVMEGFNDLRSNGGKGIDIQGDTGSPANSSRSHNITANVQANAEDGVNCETRFNTLSIYAENNGGDEILLTSDSTGNFVVSRNGEVTNNNSGNLIIGRQTDNSYALKGQPVFDRDGWKIFDTGLGGSYTMSHPSSSNYECNFDDVDSDQAVTYKNIVNLADPSVDYPTRSINETVHRTYKRMTSHLSGANAILDTWGGWSSYTPPSNATRNTLLADGSIKNGAGVYGSYCDRSLKENIEYLTAEQVKEQAVDVMSFKFAKFNMIGDPLERTMLNVIAQDLKETSPGLVDINTVIDSIDEDGVEHTKEVLGVKDSIMNKKAIVALQYALVEIERLSNILEDNNLT